MTPEQRDAAIADTEAWFERRGLPFFVEGSNIDLDVLVRGRSLVVLLLVYVGSLVAAAPDDHSWLVRLSYALVGLAFLLTVAAAGNVLRRRKASAGRLRRVGVPELAVFALGPAAVALVLRGDGEMFLGILLVDVTVLGVALAVEVLDVRPIARWALARTFQELGSLFPLVTRALPMLLLFMTFLFINTEVWQVASSMSRPVLWLAVAFFGGLGMAFLLARLPEEVAQVNDELGEDVVRRALRGSPLEQHMDELGEIRPEPLTGRQRTNLLLVLLIAQLAQVLLLALTVWLFFLCFGRVAISDEVIASWVGDLNPQAPTYPRLLGELGFSEELLQVSIFLAAFGGLYFTVYAVTDATYRKQFFTAITDDLETAVGVRAGYLSLCRDRAGDGGTG